MQQGLVSVADTDDALFDRLFAINVKGTFNTLRLAAKRLRQGGRGGIVTNHKTGKGCRAFTSPLFALNPSPLKSLFTLDRRGKLKKSSAAQSEYFSMRARRRMAFCGITRWPSSFGLITPGFCSMLEEAYDEMHGGNKGSKIAMEKGE